MNKIPVIYTAEMNGSAQASPSSEKPGRVVEAWIQAKLPVTFEPPPGARGLIRAEISRAHDYQYVWGVLDGHRVNGFGTRSPEVAESVRWTTAGMYGAVIKAMENGHVACSPVSGFHHAGYEEGGGFCTFNGLVIAAILARERHAARSVGILDADQHFGDGTEDIIEKKGLSFIKHFTAGREFFSPEHAHTFLARLPKIVESFRDVNVLLYQAGADPHVDDPLGGWLTSGELRERDRIVFEGCKKYGIPVAWNLAGGYQTPFSKVISIHVATMEEAVRVFVPKETEKP